VKDEQALLPSPPPPRVGRLNTLAGVRQELVRLYREARAGTLPTQEATRLTFILQAIAKIIEGHDLEARLNALEQRAAHARTHTQGGL